jgi:hypothetical protein
VAVVVVKEEVTEAEVVVAAEADVVVPEGVRKRKLRNGFPLPS